MEEAHAPICLVISNHLAIFCMFNNETDMLGRGSICTRNILFESSISRLLPSRPAPHWSYCLIIILLFSRYDEATSATIVQLSKNDALLTKFVVVKGRLKVRVSLTLSNMTAGRRFISRGLGKFAEELAKLKPKPSAMPGCRQAFQPVNCNSISALGK